MARILAIEPDPETSGTLQRLLGEHLGADVIVSVSARDAVSTLPVMQPDVILTSSLLPAHDDEYLTTHLRHAPDLDHLPVLTVPPIAERTESPEPKKGLLYRLWRLGRRRPSEPAFDFTAFAARIVEALEQSKIDAQESAIERPARLLLLEGSRPMLLGDGTVVEPQPLSLMRLDHDIRARLQREERRLRGQRWRGHELPWLNTIKLGWGAKLKLVNISKGGILVESTDGFTTGSPTEFQLEGPEHDLVVKARVVRAVSKEDSHGVRHIAAAAFDQPFEILGPEGLIRPPYPGRYRR